MMDCACSMGSMTWMMLLPALFLAALVVGGIVLVRRLWPSGASEGDGSALQILKERFAKGEIDRDEFNERREHLRS